MHGRVVSTINPKELPAREGLKSRVGRCHNFGDGEQACTDHHSPKCSYTPSKPLVEMKYAGVEVEIMIDAQFFLQPHLYLKNNLLGIHWRDDYVTRKYLVNTEACQLEPGIWDILLGPREISLQ